MRINGRTMYAISVDAKTNDIYIAGDKIDDCIFTIKKLELLDINVCGIILNSDINMDNIVNGYRYMHPSMLKNKNVMVVYTGSDYYKWHKYLERYGLKAGKDFKWVKRYGMDNIMAEYKFDPVLGFNSLGNNKNYPGYTMYGNESGDKEKKTVMIMGGSNTDSSMFLFKSWPEILYKISKKNNSEMIIFNGAVRGFSSQQELLKAIRDIPIIKPDIVISYSGVNNIHLVDKYPYLLDYHVKLVKYFENRKAPTINLCNPQSSQLTSYSQKDLDKYKFWMYNEKMMHYYCGLYNASFFCVFQPVMMSKGILLKEEREYIANRSFMGRNGLTPQEYRAIAIHLKEKVKREKFEWMYDFSEIFDDELQSVYIDGIHVNEKGNEIIAKRILNLIDNNKRL